MKHLILHIGAPKCGSTYLQKVLLKHQRQLRTQGVNYPHTGTGTGHPGNADRITDVSPHWLTATFGGFHTAVLSHENLFSQAKSAIRLGRLCALNDVQVTIFCVLRPFPDMVFADYSQFLKQNFQTFCDAGRAFDGMDFRQFAQSREPKWQVHQFLADWSAALPQAQLTLCPLYSLQAGFCDIVPQAQTLDWALPRWQANPSLPMALCEQIADDINQGRIDQAKTRMQQQNAGGFDPNLRGHRRWIS